jgi:SCF-associated factor 1
LTGIDKHTIIEDPNQVIAVGAGDNFCAALKANGELWFLEVGENDNFHLTSGPDKAANWGNKLQRRFVARMLPRLTYSTTKTFSVKFAELSTADPHISTIDTPSGIPVRKVVMGDYHTVACDHAGHAFAWGENTAGQLGRGEIGSRNVGVPESVLEVTCFRPLLTVGKFSEISLIWPSFIVPLATLLRGERTRQVN